MANQRKLGVYWGDLGIDLVEMDRDVLVTSAHLSFADLDKNPMVGIKHVTEDLRLLDMLQKAIRENSFSVSNVFLSFPAKDIILRWFLIPWMKPEEIQGVVAFEARKYIPFPLEDLIYTYYPSTMTHAGARQIGVVFTAIRKASYERYTNVLLQAGMNVVYSEPSPVSLLRALSFKKLIHADRVCAVVNVGAEKAEMLIATQGNVKFIRDFSISPRGGLAPVQGSSEDLSRAKLFNEIRMSLEFFSRLGVGADVDRAVVVSSGRPLDFFNGMEEDTGLSVQKVDADQLLSRVGCSLGMVCAFGVALSGAVASVIDFNLSEGQGGQVAADKKKIVARAPLLPRGVFLGGAVAAGCAALFLGSWVLTGTMLESKKAQKAAVVARLGSFVDVPLEQIETKGSFLKKKSKAVKSLPFHSGVTPFLIRLVQLIPEGVWLESVDVVYKDEPLSARPAGASGKAKPSAEDYYEVRAVPAMHLSGYASLNDTNGEFELVGQFVDALAADPQLAKVFSTIKRQSLEARAVDGRTVSAFTVDFK